MADNKFFTNTYITGYGRQNYLRIDNFEDPLFTSFTFDIDFITSPLFYTIGNKEYSDPNEIEEALKGMRESNMTEDNGYDILPVMSADNLGGLKLGFGLQQNVYMDKPLYGAAEYIYMVDKRNGGLNQNDVRYDSNSVDSPNELNSYKLGDTVKEIVNENDREWAERQQKQNLKQIVDCEKIMSDKETEHVQNKNDYENAKINCDSIKCVIDGEEFDESKLETKVKECEDIINKFEKLKKDIANYVNKKLTEYKNKGVGIYSDNQSIQEIFVRYTKSNDSNRKQRLAELKKLFAEDSKQKDLISYVNDFNKLYGEVISESNSFLLQGTPYPYVRSEFVKENEIFKNIINELELGEISIPIYSHKDNCPEWATIESTKNLCIFAIDGENKNELSEVSKKIEKIMGFKCDEDSFNNLTSDIIEKCQNDLEKYKKELENIRYLLYGMENGEVCTKDNPSPDSPYAKYLEAKERYENDDYTQAQKAKEIAEYGNVEMNNMINDYDIDTQLSDNDGEFKTVKSQSEMRLSPPLKELSQTVLDMLGFISGMKKMTREYPYIIQGITGLDTAYNKHYGIKDPYLGSGDDKITLTCLESLDLRVSSMFNRYFNAVYDRQYRRERVPINLRRFNCSVYVHDVRNFVAYNSRTISNGRVMELKDMYHSVIEFKFFDCEIVPEETGNIFNDISNEAPTEMKKTNFTFTYGNCVVNFVPITMFSLEGRTLDEKLKDIKDLEGKAVTTQQLGIDLSNRKTYNPDSNPVKTSNNRYYWL